MSSMVSRLVAGFTLNFADRIAAYPASAGWTLRYRLIPTFTAPVQVPIDLTAAPFEGDAYQVTAAPATTAAWQPGAYTWSRWVERAGEAHPLGVGRLVIDVNPMTAAAGYDGRTLAARALDEAMSAFAAAQTAAASGARQAVEYSIAGRSVKYADAQQAVAALMQTVNFWRAEVEREDRTARLVAGLPARNTYALRIR